MKSLFLNLMDVRWYRTILDTSKTGKKSTRSLERCSKEIRLHDDLLKAIQIDNEMLWPSCTITKPYQESSPRKKSNDLEKGKSKRGGKITPVTGLA